MRHPTSGGFAECFRVERMEDKKSFALKIINKKNLEKPKAKQKVKDVVIQDDFRNTSS